MKKKSGIKKKTIRAIHDEMNAATAKHGWHMTPLNSQMPNGQKLTVLVEEIGEVARAMTYDNGDREKLYAELIQVATMSAAWANSLKNPMYKDWVTTS